MAGILGRTLSAVLSLGRKELLSVSIAGNGTSAPAAASLPDGIASVARTGAGAWTVTLTHKGAAQIFVQAEADATDILHASVGSYNSATGAFTVVIEQNEGTNTDLAVGEYLHVLVVYAR